MQGYVKLHRKLLDNPILLDGDALRLFIYLLLRANHKPKEIMFNNQTISVKRGELVAGRRVLSRELNMHPSMVNRKLKGLGVNEVIKVKSNNRFSLITIVNYGKYQDRPKKSNNQRTSGEQLANTNKNVKNERMKEIISSPKNGEGLKINSNYLSKFNTPKKIYTSGQALADELFSWGGPRFKFGMWARLVKLKGEDFVRQKWAEVRQSNAKDPPALLLSMLKRPPPKLNQNSGR